MFRNTGFAELHNLTSEQVSHIDVENATIDRLISEGKRYWVEDIPPSNLFDFAVSKFGVDVGTITADYTSFFKALQD